MTPDPRETEDAEQRQDSRRVIELVARGETVTVQHGTTAMLARDSEIVGVLDVEGELVTVDELDADASTTPEA